MKYNLVFKNTVLLFVLLILACGSSGKSVENREKKKEVITETTNKEIVTGAENTSAYLSLLKGKKIGVITNQTGIINIESEETKITSNGTKEYLRIFNTISIVDFFINNQIKVEKIFAPEHGFRGTADAGEHIIDGKDTKTGLPIISLYGNNKKPKPEQLQGIDVMIFDLQDVGARFYTYISTLHYIMEACAENNIPLIVLDRPNPNGSIVDGPILEKEFSSFVGMHTIPLLHGMTIGEYAQMINGEKWLKDGIQCDLKLIPCLNYDRNMLYSLPVKPSPNLPNDHAINLYASLCLFEGTNVSVGRGTDMQFQIYGSPYLPKSVFSFTPNPNIGAKDPLYKGKECFGENLSDLAFVDKLEIKWLIKAYNSTTDKSKFFNDFFVKLAGTKKLREQIEKGVSETEIRKSWRKDIEAFKKMREKYLLYK
jgi:uncharacterized protein YbbC (DUF1343 family)